MSNINIKTIAKSCLKILVELPDPKNEDDICLLTFEPSDVLNNGSHNLRVQIDKLNEEGLITYSLSDHNQDNGPDNSSVSNNFFKTLLNQLYKYINVMEKEIGPVVNIRIQSGDTNVFDLKLDSVISDKQKKENMIMDKILDIFDNYEVPSMEKLLDRASNTNNTEFTTWFLSDNIINIDLLKKYINH